MTSTLTAIYAISENNMIGKNNDIPWRLRDDLRRFMKLTLGKPLIMGRKTFESLNGPLPRRRNIVITRNPDYTAVGIEVAHSLEEAIALCKGEPDISLGGGATLYEEAFEKDLVDVIQQTTVHAEVDGDTTLNTPDTSVGWELEEVVSNQADEKNEFAYTYLTFRRIRA